MDHADLIVEKSDILKANWKSRSPRGIGDGEARLEIEALALTANNVTYAVFADFAGYWNFFPTGEDTLGRVPHWGFAKIVESTVDTLPTGTRVYGYLPCSSDLVIQPGKFDPYGFYDLSPHRAELPHFYNRLHLTETDPAYDGAYEDIQMLVRPLYATGWLLDDYVVNREAPPAQILVSSASSKTALAMAHKLRSRDGLMVTGLTSEKNVPFVQNTGFYDTVVSYDALEDIPGIGPAILTDFLGDPSLRTKLDNTLGDIFAGTVAIGATAWDAERAMGTDASGKPVEMFFAPGHADVMAKRVGPAELAQSMNSDMRAFYPTASDLLTVKPVTGHAAILEAWHQTVSGSIPPTDGLILKLA